MCFVFVFNLILCVTVFEGFDNYTGFIIQSEIRSMFFDGGHYYWLLFGEITVIIKKVGHLTFEKKNEINNKLINIRLLS